ncbi:hypothetical protein PIB30_116722 [Stylosanthes scabra]|uniref:Uncharacterized protein n=1 Tax=Stylosanthes scabra TaxID=79078 RepID=A0ABU6QTM4_9FABA|nr:hypothetical protein [Stylosanthes scabra]
MFCAPSPPIPNPRFFGSQFLGSFFFFLSPAPPLLLPSPASPPPYHHDAATSSSSRLWRRLHQTEHCIISFELNVKVRKME